ncbi:uncharacterized protein LOC110020041 isoform X3 [Phalaenopsis equestris]|uniref:uncharacterized protein LOC110020041 isoform X3 n=1 Tax=Phalaenopsis equestris TaxID=78828 RepID=UPI0009E4AB23|nr:uncharacterized protein LOC110020041 isoform X3 [Phalaenopsis equestris]
MNLLFMCVGGEHVQFRTDDVANGFEKQIFLRVYLYRHETWIFHLGDFYHCSHIQVTLLELGSHDQEDSGLHITKPKRKVCNSL